MAAATQQGSFARVIVERASQATAKVIADSDLKTRFENMGIVFIGNTPDQARQLLDDEIAKWARVISAAGVKSE